MKRCNSRTGQRASASTEYMLSICGINNTGNEKPLEKEPSSTHLTPLIFNVPLLDGFLK